MKTRMLQRLPFLLVLTLIGVQGYSVGNVASTDYGNQNEDQQDIQKIADLLHPASTDVDIHKDIFSFAPPESELNDDTVIDLPQSGPKTRYRIVFIRSPDFTKDFSRSVAQLAAASKDQRTIIYVLQKHSDIKDLSNRLEQLNRENPNKPEVHFVKYRSSDEANEVLKTIQSKYDSLEGTTKQHQTEVAPLLHIPSKFRKYY